MIGIVEILRDRAESYRQGGPSSEHTASILDEAASEIERLARDLSRRRAEDEAAVLFLRKMTELVPIRDVMTATATIGTLIEYFAAAVDKSRSTPNAR